MPITRSPLKRQGTSQVKGQFRTPKQNKIPVVGNKKPQRTIGKQSTPQPQPLSPEKQVLPTADNFSTIPNPPITLKTEGRDKWNFYWERLIAREQANPDFMPTIEIICNQHDICYDLLICVKKYGAASKLGIGAAKALNTISRNIIALQHEFGFTLASKPSLKGVDTSNNSSTKSAKPKTAVDYPDQGDIFDEV